MRIYEDKNCGYIPVELFWVVPSVGLLAAKHYLLFLGENIEILKRERVLGDQSAFRELLLEVF